MTSRHLFLIIYISLSIINTQAQNHIIFHHLTVDDGLSQSSVTCILQDKTGFMWFGTEDGLNRYDGYNIKVFKNNPTDSSSLANNFIFTIYEDSSGTMYVETQGGGFHKYNPLTESFSRLKKGGINLRETKYNTVNAFFEDIKGVQWTGGMSAGTGLKRTDKKTGKVIIYKHSPSNPSSLSDD